MDHEGHFYNISSYVPILATRLAKLPERRQLVTLPAVAELLWVPN
jgi:hypothetical protein